MLTWNFSNMKQENLFNRTTETPLEYFLSPKLHAQRTPVLFSPWDRIQRDIWKLGILLILLRLKFD